MALIELSKTEAAGRRTVGLGHQDAAIDVSPFETGRSPSGQEPCETMGLAFVVIKLACVWKKLSGDSFTATHEIYDMGCESHDEAVEDLLQGTSLLWGIGEIAASLKLFDGSDREGLRRLCFTLWDQRRGFGSHRISRLSGSREDPDAERPLRAG